LGEEPGVLGEETEEGELVFLVPVPGVAGDRGTNCSGEGDSIVTSGAVDEIFSAFLAEGPEGPAGERATTAGFAVESTDLSGGWKVFFGATLGAFSFV